MHMVELKNELKKLERDLSLLVARFLKIYDEFAEDRGDAPAASRPTPEEETPQHMALAPGFTTDYLTAYA